MTILAERIQDELHKDNVDITIGVIDSILRIRNRILKEEDTSSSIRPEEPPRYITRKGKRVLISGEPLASPGFYPPK